MIENTFAFLKNNEVILFWISILSILFFFISLLFIKTIILKIPDDYFIRKKNLFISENIYLSILYLFIKNIIGIIFLIGGVMMLVLPGQGILTIIIALMLLDFPGKKYFEGKIIKSKPVLKSINWVRKKSNKAPLRVN